MTGLPVLSVHIKRTSVFLFAPWHPSITCRAKQRVIPADLKTCEHNHKCLLLNAIGIANLHT